MPKKKRKLIIKATGAGDPTFFLTINIPLEPNESVGDTLTVSMDAVINQSVNAMTYDGNEMPALPLGVDLDFASNFLTPNSNNGDVDVAITFLNAEYDFEFENPPNLSASYSNNTIFISSINILPPGNIDLGASNTLVFQTLENHENGNLVYLSQQDITLTTKSIFSTQDNQFVWQVNLVENTVDQYTIMNLLTGKYLEITSNDKLGLSPYGTNSTSHWTMLKVSPDFSKYQISIQQNGTTYYLYSDSTIMQVSLNSNPSPWYLFIN